MAALALAGLSAGPAVAEQTPRGGRADSRVKTVVFRPDDVVGLSATYGVSTMVQFGEGEKIETVALGDSLAWQVIPNKRGNLLFVKPVEPKAATNMNVVTDKRVYSFALAASPVGQAGGPTFKLRFAYPEEATDARLLAAARARAEAPNLRSLADRGVNADYGYKGSEANRPTAAFDDGVKTYFRFASNGETPAIFVVGPNRDESLVNGRREGEYLVIDKVARQWTLRNGDQATCVFNLVKPDPEEAAQRELIGPRRLGRGWFL